MSDLKSSIHPAALDLMLDSASNAAQKGQSQYSTPLELAQRLAADLPAFRPIIVDLTCGPGLLLHGAANKTTGYLLGCDVDPRGRAELPLRPAGRKIHFLHADLTQLYEPMRQIDFRADCLVLNPPWSLHWHAGRLAGLADSDLPAVAKVFKEATGDAAASPCQDAIIDSTLATLLIALDRLSDVGDGLLIGYTSTLQRLLFDPGAIGAPLVQHIWKKVQIADCRFENSELCIPNSSFEDASALYFHREHERGPLANGQRPPFLPGANSYNLRRDTMDQWNALTERMAAAAGAAAGRQSRYHLSLRGNAIHVRLGLFDGALVRVNKDLAKTAERLHELEGRNPLQVVMQRNERNFILGLVRGPGSATVPVAPARVPPGGSQYPWTVSPELKDAVQTALNQYNASRAPMIPLPKIQRLGYLDEADDIYCVKDLEYEGVVVFHKDQRYTLTTQSKKFTRVQWKPNLHGEEEELELTGQELAIIITSPVPKPDEAEDKIAVTKRIGGGFDKPGRGGKIRTADESTTQYCFMDAGLRRSDIKIGADEDASSIHFTLQDLVEHFEIPEVPDLATLDPDRYKHFVNQLKQLEELTA